MRRVHHFQGILASAVLVLCAFTLAGCSQLKDEKVDLSTGWEYSLTDPMEASSSFKPLDDKDLPELHRLLPEQRGTIWLKKTFDLPETLKNEDIACYLGRISIADRTYLNGTLIGNEGFFPPNEFTAWNVPRFYDIPESIIKDHEKNELLVEIFVDGEGSIVSGPFIGLNKTAKTQSQVERFWNTQINLMFAFVMAIISFYHLLIWHKNKSEKENLYFAVINLATALYMIVFFLPELPGAPYRIIPFLLFQKIFSSILPFTLPFLITSFVNTYLKRKDHIAILITRIVFLAIPVIVILCAPDYVHLRAWRSYYQIFLVPPIAYIIYVLILSCIQKKKDTVALLMGFSPFVITALLDVILHDWLKIYNLPYFSSIGWQLVILALLFVLSSKFTSARKSAEYLNVHLQDEVNARTHELSESNSQLTSANEQLEKINARAAEDMKLAVYVQQSFFPRWSPNCDDWDIAYKFKPSAGVSGDLYDFYSSKGKLNGVALFDVSGHGIASGLVTMLAKNAISAKFTSNMSIKLSTVMQKINEHFIDLKGDVENYMTGVLLRIDGSKIQCLNAGHPAVFLRTDKTGKSVPVRLPEDDGETPPMCGLVGIPGMPVDYKAVQFSVNQGDALILYTDCLSESRNAEGEEYGQQAISDVFAKSGSGNAQSKLDYVLSAFEKFTEGVPLKDDLTVIVLQKK